MGHKADELEGEPAIAFPVILFNRRQGFAAVVRDAEALTTTTAAALRDGFWDDAMIVDLNQTALEAKGADKLGGVGLFGGYNLFLNRRLKIRLRFAGPPRRISLDEIKALIKDSFERWEGWATRDDFDELKARVQGSRSVREIMDSLS